MIRLLILAMLCATCAIAQPVMDGLLPNGNFEGGPEPSQLNGTLVVDPHAIPYWEITGNVEYIKFGETQGELLPVVPKTGSAVRLQGKSSIKQSVLVIQGMLYSITFSAYRYCALDENLNVTVLPSSEPNDWGIIHLETIISNYGWDAYSWGFIAASDHIDIVIQNPGIADYPTCGPLIDAVALKALNRPEPTRGNLLVNGNFEEGPYMLPNRSWGVNIPSQAQDNHPPLPGWMVESSGVRYIDSEHFGVPQGQRAVELIKGMHSSISQVVESTQGKLYNLVFFTGDPKDTCVGKMIVEAFAGNATKQIRFRSYGLGLVKKAKLQFLAESSITKIGFTSKLYNQKSEGSSCGPVIDDVKLSPVRRVTNILV